MSAKRRLRKVSRKYENDRQQSFDDLDALDPRRIGSSMPAQETEYREMLKREEMCDSTRRRGAGDIKGGGLVLRPGGMGNYREFHDLYTREPEKKEPEKRINPSEQKGQYRGPQMRVIAFPEWFCIQCARRDVQPPKPGCTTKNCFCCPMLDVIPCMEDFPSRNVWKGDAIRSFFCGACKNQIIGEGRQNRANRMRVVHEGTDMPMHVMYSMIRIKKMEQNIRDVLKASDLVPVEGKQGVRAEGIGAA